jgi:flavorubredoxin
MGITNQQAGTRIDEIAERIYRISTPVPPTVIPGGFTFNVFLIADQHPLLFHTAPRAVFPLVREAIETVMPIGQLRFISFSHFESDECGALNSFLELAPEASPVCGRIGAMASVNDFALRPAKVMADGESLALGAHTVQWLDMPHVPHSWDCGMMFERSTGTLLCSDLFTQAGNQAEPLTQGDILGPSEILRSHLEYYAHSPNTGALLEKAAALNPTTLACMHGSSWRGDGAGLIRELAAILAK